MYRTLLAIIALFIFQNISGQEKMSIALRDALLNNASLYLIVDGDPSAIKDAVKALGGRFKYSVGNRSSIVLPQGAVKPFSSLTFVKHIEFNSHKYHILNDSMVVNSNVLPVHAGSNPLPQAYKGKNVVIGILDTGIEIDHPDFMDSLSNTRILAIWDHRYPSDTNSPQPYGYGQLWDSASINANLCPHHDSLAFNGHGTHVAGIAAGNGLAVGNFGGVAPEADILVASLDFWSSGFEVRLADAVHWMFHFADSIGKPCVINASVGDYLGSHDGRDDATLIIDSLLDEKGGRAFVCAAGNSGKMPPYHLGYNVPQDTAFTWFEFNPSTVMGYPGYYFELWSDVPDFTNVEFAFGMDKISPTYNFRGATSFDNIQNRLNVNYLDSITNTNGDILAYVETWAELHNGRYLLQVKVANPDSSQYRLRLMTRGSGRFDLWSSAWNGLNDMTSTGLPTSVEFPWITHYEKPDSNKTIVSDWACSDHTITTANYTNRDRYIDYNSTLQVYTETPGAIEASSSFGPTRNDLQKPEIAAAGGRVLSCGTIEQLTWMYVNLPSKVALGGWHKTNGGTSMASPQVAGVAALLLQRCPEMTWKEIKQSIIPAAVQDGFTGNVPNYRWGNGKLDAFSAMQNIVFQPEIIPGDTLLHFCQGDSVFITLNGNYSNYLWSNGDTTEGIWINNAGSYSVIVNNQSGCIGYSDTLIAIIDSLPPKPVITQDADTLSANISNSYQWMLNGNNLVGDTSLSLVISQSGYYQVIVTDSNGCSNISDSLYAIYSEVPQFNKQGSLHIYPNPAGKELNVRVNGFEDKNAEIYLLDVLGNKLVENKIYSLKYQDLIKIDLKKIPAGIYFLYLAADNSTIYSKIIRK